MTTQSSSFPDSSTLSPRKPGMESRSTGEILEFASSELKAKAGEALEKGRGRVSEMMHSGSARLGEWKGGFQEGIREKPIQSVLVAAGIGAAIGLLLGRRSR